MDFSIIGANSEEKSHCNVFSDKSIIGPNCHNKHFEKWLLSTVKKEKINFIISGINNVNKKLSLISQIQNKLLNIDANILNIFDDKFKTIKWLSLNKIKFPKSIKINRNSHYQVISQYIGRTFILKKLNGKSSEFVFIVNNKKKFEKIIDECKKYVAQEIINFNDIEYTCGVYKSKFNYIKIIILERKIKKGTTIFAKVITNEKIRNYCLEIAKCFPSFSSFNVQLKLNNKNEPICFEINPRFSGTTFIRHKFGFKDLESSINEFYFKKNSEKIFKLKEGIAIRFYDEKIYLH